MLLSTQKTWGICKQLFCILCLCSKHQITEVSKYFFSWTLGENSAYGGFTPNIIECQAGEMWWTVYFNSQAPVTSVRVCFILADEPSPLSRAFPPCHWVSSCWQKGTKVFPFLVYMEVPFALQNISPHEDFHVFSLINLSSVFSEVILSIISVCQNSL